MDQTFTNSASASAFFTDRTLDLGPIGAGVSGPLDLTLEMDATVEPGDGFASNVLLGNVTPGSGVVPEPSGGLLLCGTAGVLCAEPDAGPVVEVHVRPAVGRAMASGTSVTFPSLVAKASCPFFGSERRLEALAP